MSEKEKPKRSSKMSLLRSLIIFLGYPSLIVMGCTCGYLYWLFGGYVKPSLDPQYIPTAEYLLEHPVETGDFSLKVSYNDSGDPNYQCIAVYTSSRELLETVYSSDFYINEQTVGHFFDGQNYIESNSMFYRSFCVNGHLDSGLHIFEFRAKKDPFAEPYYIHRWAIEIP